jgi:hypothetical protein
MNYRLIVGTGTEVTGTCAFWLGWLEWPHSSW